MISQLIRFLECKRVPIAQVPGVSKFLIALLWCVGCSHTLAMVAPVTSIEPSSVDTRWSQGHLAAVRDHWFRSHVKFSGHTVQDDDRRQGRLGVSADSLLLARHSMGVSFNESDSRKAGNEFASLSFHYAFPVGGNQFRLEASHSEYDNAVVGSDRKYQAHGLGRSLKLQTRRSLLSIGPLAVSSMIQFSSHDGRRYEDGSWVKDTSRQRSVFQLEGVAKRELWSGVLATTTLTATNGLEVSRAAYEVDADWRRCDRIRKLSFMGRLSRELLNWQWGLSGRYQYAVEDLPSSQHLLLAGPGMMSGFAGRSLSAAEGGWLRLDANSPYFPMPGLAEVQSDFRLSVLQGWTPELGAESGRIASVSAAELALIIRRPGLQADLSIGQMIASQGIEADEPEAPDVSFSLSLDI